MKSWNDDFVKHWKYYKHPARPGKHEIAFIEKVITSIDNPRVLLLGSTPEIRDLCGKLGIKVVCFEQNTYNFEYLGKEIKHKPEEEMFSGSWVTDNPGEFDVIYGDAVINVMGDAKNVLPQFVKNMSKILSQRGRLLLKTYLLVDNILSPEEVFKRYRNEWKHFGLFSATMDKMFLAVYDVAKDTMVLGDVWKAAVALHDKGLMTDDELDYYHKCHLKDSTFTFYFPARKYLEDEYEKCFKIDSVFFSPEAYIGKDIPIHVLRI